MYGFDAYMCLFGRIFVFFECAYEADLKYERATGLCLQIYQTSKRNRLKCSLLLNLYVMNFQAASLNTVDATAKRRRCQVRSNY